MMRYAVIHHDHIRIFTGKDINTLQEEGKEIISVPIHDQDGDIIHDDRIVIWGMSCVGKTTMAKEIGRDGRHIHCFDALYPWSDIECLGLSAECALDYIGKHCRESRFVLDGWNLSDREGRFLPPACTLYILYAELETILRQYRVQVHETNNHREMFRKWYLDDHPPCPARYFFNTGQVIRESSRDDFTSFLTGSR